LSILHRTDLPSDVGAGPLIMLHEIVDITGASIREDRSQVAIKLQTGTGDRLVLGFTPGGIDAMIETLAKIRADMTAAGIEQTIPFQPVHTAQVGVHEHDARAFVSMILDRSLPSAKAYLMPPTAARALSKQLKTCSQHASGARGEPIVGVD